MRISVSCGRNQILVLSWEWPWKLMVCGCHRFAAKRAKKTRHVLPVTLLTDIIESTFVSYTSLLL